MKPSLTLLFLICCKSWSRVDTAGPIDPAVLEKLRSIQQWLDLRSDVTVFDYIFRVNRGVGLNLFEGDIKGYTPMQAMQRTAITNHQQLWNTRVVPYVIDSSFDSIAQKDIQAAIDEYHAKTCIRFIPRTSEDDYVNFKQISGCYSNIGRVGGEQDISLMGACLKKGTAIHEMMHALGFWHEQSRPDRDSWVQVIKGNIQTGKEYNFDKLSSSEADTLGVGYDYGSVMHYSRYAFSKNGNPTILPTRQTDAELGQREGLSDHDVYRIRKLYGCDIDAPKTTIKVEKPTTPKPQPSLPPTTPAAVLTTPLKTVTTQKIPITTQAPLQTSRLLQTTERATKPTQPTGQAVSVSPTTLQPTTVTEPRTYVNTVPSTVRPVNTAGWTSWSAWSPCDMDCKHSRYRFCLNYEAVYCPGENSQITTCQIPCRPTVSLGCWKYNRTKVSIPSVNTSVADNQGSFNVLVKCRNHAASQGFSTYAIFDSRFCLTGTDAESQYSVMGISNGCFGQTGGRESINVFSFNTDVVGQWSLWTGWGPCTKVCGTGRQHRYRRCDNPPPRGNGAPCSGISEETAVCNLQPCIEPTKCGTKYHAGGPGSSGLIWVRDYENFMECDYQIATGDPLASISIYIHELDIEYSRGCIYDRIELYDGRSRDSPLVGTFCGKSQPGAFESSSRFVYLKFISDETNTGRGYTIFYSINSRSRKSCVKPPSEAHASINIEGNMVGNRVWYNCDPGYKLVGRSPITCLNQPGFALWNDNYPRCVHMRKRSVMNPGRDMCTFEDSLCGLVKDSRSSFEWTVSRPATQSNRSSDLQSLRGNFLHAESTPIQQPGDKARVHLIQNYTETTAAHCLRYMYKIDGASFSLLNIYVSHGTTAVSDVMVQNMTQHGEEADPILLNTVHGQSENVWSSARIDVKLSSPFTVTFEAVLGEEIGSSVSLDDVFLQPGTCTAL